MQRCGHLLSPKFYRSRIKRFLVLTPPKALCPEKITTMQIFLWWNENKDRKITGQQFTQQRRPEFRNCQARANLSWPPFCYDKKTEIKTYQVDPIILQLTGPTWMSIRPCLSKLTPRNFITVELPPNGAEVGENWKKLSVTFCSHKKQTRSQKIFNFQRHT